MYKMLKSKDAEIVTMADFEQCKERWRNSPRVHGRMADAFRSYVLGLRRPHRSPLHEKDEALFLNDADLLYFRDVYLEHCGTFKHHLVSNIPYAFQQDCSMGAAFTAYLQYEYAHRSVPVSLWTIGNSEGVIARSVARLGGGNIFTLNNNETPENEADFNRLRPPTAFFLAGPFCDVTTSALASYASAMPEKFSVIHENLSFQMIENNRRQQIAYVSQFLEEGGLFTLYEKCIVPDDRGEYLKRESVKKEFQKQYLSQDGMTYDQQDLQTFMEQGQVGLVELVEEVARAYPHVAMVWNSCNFYVVVASKDPEKVRRFCAMFYPPYIPGEYRFVDLSKPMKLHGLEGVELVYRADKHSLISLYL